MVPTDGSDAKADAARRALEQLVEERERNAAEGEAIAGKIRAKTLEASEAGVGPSELARIIRMGRGSIYRFLDAARLERHERASKRAQRKKSK